MPLRRFGLIVLGYSFCSPPPPPQPFFLDSFFHSRLKFLHVSESMERHFSSSITSSFSQEPSLHDGVVLASSRKTGRTHSGSHPGCLSSSPPCLWVSSGHTVVPRGKSVSGSACSPRKLVALEGFLETLPTCLLPSSSRLSTLLRSGRGTLLSVGLAKSRAIRPGVF